MRPDPQVIWNTPRNHPRWKNCDARYQRSSSGGGKWTQHHLPERWQIHYGPLTFNIKPMNFKHTGVFPEQAANWDFIMQMVQSAGRPVSVLNLFAYTGGATLAAAAAGAAVWPCGCCTQACGMGAGKRPRLRAGGSAHPMDCGRLCLICGAGNQARPAL